MAQNPPRSPDRLRRLRRTGPLRAAAADVTIPLACLIYPVFVTGEDQPRPVASMPGVQQWPVGLALEQMTRWVQAGLRSFLLFGVTPDARKNAAGDYALDPGCPVNCLLAAAREADLDATLIADACFCEYTAHGHCGILTADPADPSVIDTDRTRAQLAQLAVAQAKAGAHVVAPSAMCDGQVAAMRAALDGAGFGEVAILGYSVKYASSFYGPFREAGGCSLKPSPLPLGEGPGVRAGQSSELGARTDFVTPLTPALSQGEREPDRPAHRRAYQMDYRRSREWRIELEADLAEGADAVMVKPAAHYLDVLRQVREACAVPVAAYHVSGEYAMLHAAAERGWLDLRASALEATYAIRRAGADWVITYFAPQLIEWAKG